MKKCFFVFLIAFDITLCHKQMKSDQINDKKCKNIKCPSDDNPVCVQITKKSMKNNKPTNVVMVNECEMQYMKCHQGLSAIMVPMKNCRHDDLIHVETMLKAKKLKNYRLRHRKALNQPFPIKTLELNAEMNEDESKASIKNSEEGGKESTEDNKHSPLTKSTESIHPENAGFKVASSDERNAHNEQFNVASESKASSKNSIEGNKESAEGNEHLPLSKSTEFVNPDNSEIKAATSDESRAHNEEFNVVSGNETEKEPNISKNSEEGDKGPTGDNEHSPLPKSTEHINPDNAGFKAASDKSNTYSEEFNAASEYEIDKDPAVDYSYKELKTIDNSHEGKDGESSKTNDDLAFKQPLETSDLDKHVMGFEDNHDEVTKLMASANVDYEAVCPSSCPIRDVMVCAKCPHGVYRTFISICHMRMFSCHHKDEALELVSRQPCMMSAPYIIDKEKLQQNQRISEPDDYDNILRYILCREKGLADNNGLRNFGYNYHCT